MTVALALPTTFVLNPLIVYSTSLTSPFAYVPLTFKSNAAPYSYVSLLEANATDFNLFFNTFTVRVTVVTLPSASVAV